MAELRNYEIDEGNGMKTTVQLTAEDAERLGATEVGPAHDVQVTAEDDASADDASDATKTGAARTVQNRARRTA